jgi:outer membrane receptor protein involved in Fe transport
MLSDRFYRGPVGRGFIEGNPDLDPETSLQVDVVARYDTGGLAVSGAFYDYRISNLIERYQPGPNSFLYRNRGAARLRGAELEVRAAPRRGFSLAMTAQASRGRDEADGTPVDDIAPASVSVVARHGAGPLRSYLRATAFRSHDSAGPTEVPTPAYCLVDAGAAWRIGRRVQLAVVVRNLLDEAYPSSAGPRWVYAPGRYATVTSSVGF